MEAVKRKKDAFRHKLKNGHFPPNVSEQDLDKAINEREDEILAFEKDMTEGDKGQFVGVAFVSFQTEEMKQELIKRHKISNLMRFRFAFGLFSQKFIGSGLDLNGKRLYISQASEPSDVYWYNLHVGDKERYIRKLIGYIISACLLFLCALVIFYLLRLQNDLKNEEKSTNAKEITMEMQILTGILAVAIACLNKILVFAMEYIAILEKNRTITEDYSSTVFKSTLVISSHFFHSNFSFLGNVY